MLLERVVFYNYNLTPQNVLHLTNTSGDAEFSVTTRTPSTGISEVENGWIFTPGNITDFIWSHNFPVFPDEYKIEGYFRSRGTWTLQVLDSSGAVIHSWYMPANTAFQDLYFYRTFVNAFANKIASVKVIATSQISFTVFSTERNTYMEEPDFLYTVNRDGTEPLSWIHSGNIHAPEDTGVIF